MMNNSQGKRNSYQAEGVNYEEAMNQALNEIFQNLKEIQQDTKKRREKIDLQRRRGSAPATALRETTAIFKQPKKLDRKMSTPIPAAPSTLSTMRWVLQCFEEEEEEETLFERRLNQVLVS